MGAASIPLRGYPSKEQNMVTTTQAYQEKISCQLHGSSFTRFFTEVYQLSCHRSKVRFYLFYKILIA